MNQKFNQSFRKLKERVSFKSKKKSAPIVTNENFQSLNKKLDETTGLGLSNLEGAARPPDFDEDSKEGVTYRTNPKPTAKFNKKASVIKYEPNVVNPSNNVRSSFVETIKNTLADLNSDDSDSESSDYEKIRVNKGDPKKSEDTKPSSLNDYSNRIMTNSSDSTDSELNFPVRTVDDARECIKKLTEIEAQQKLKLIQQRRKIENLKKISASNEQQIEKAKTSSQLNSSQNHNSVNKIKYHHYKYVEKQRQTQAAQFKPLQKDSELYAETVNSVFDQEGDLVLRTGTVNYLGKLEFHLDKSQPLPATTPASRSPDERELGAILAEIDRFEMKRAGESRGAPIKQARYFYRGKEILRNVSFNETSTIYEYDSNSVLTAPYVPVVEQKASDEIARNILRDLLLDYQNTHQVYLGNSGPKTQ